MKELYETIGRKTVEAEAIRDNYRILLMQIERMREGNLNPVHMVIDHAAQTWRIEVPKAVPDALKLATEEPPTA